MKYGTITMTCPLCGHSFKSEVIFDAKNEGKDLDGRPRGELNKATLNDYHECLHCGHIFIENKLALPKEEYEIIKKTVSEDKDTQAKAWHFLYLEKKHELHRIDEDTSIKEVRELCRKQLEYLNNYIWALMDTKIDVRPYRAVKASLLESYISLCLFPLEETENYQLMLLEESRRLGRFNIVKNMEIDTEDEEKQNFIQFVKHLAKKQDRRPHTYNNNKSNIDFLNN